MTYTGFEAWWWPFLFILVAGWLATDSWRFLGVFLGGRISEDSEVLVFVRCVATALVAAVVASLILTPNGALADTPVVLRAGAAIGGFAAYLVAGKRMIVGLLVAEAVLVGGVLLG